jgi:ElaB/YqjD/DUF883 family membrane-anchored ribosome-binding protein
MANTAQDMKKVQSGLYETADKIENVSENFGKRAGELVSQVSGSVSDYYDTSRRFVQQNPTKGIAAAVATGVVIGSLLTLALKSK